MQNIQRLRDALSHIEGARYPISTEPPVHRHLRRHQETTLLPQGLPPMAGVDAAESPDRLSASGIEAEVFKGLDDVVSQRGMDALAWYVSFHNKAEDWGIYIPLTSVHYLADRLYRGTRVLKRTRYRLSLQILFAHEVFHFGADLAQTQLELLIHKPCHAWLAGMLKSGGYLEIEEALANAYMLRRAEETMTPAQAGPIRTFVLSQPPGYRDALPYVDSDSLYRDGLAEVIKAYASIPIISINPALSVSSLNWSRFFENRSQIDASNCPLYLLHDDDTNRLPPLAPALITCLPAIEETRNFLKRLGKLPSYLQENWNRKKAELSQRIPPYPEFEALKGDKKGLYSIRISGGHRAHLKPAVKGGRWEAINIGTHRELGHD